MKWLKDNGAPQDKVELRTLEVQAAGEQQQSLPLCVVRGAHMVQGWLAYHNTASSWLSSSTLQEDLAVQAVLCLSADGVPKVLCVCLWHWVAVMQCDGQQQLRSDG
jgi:hypothetical protein